jgi:hypothetical protein
MDMDDAFLLVRRPEREADNWPPSDAEVEWIALYLHAPYAFKAPTGPTLLTLSCGHGLRKECVGRHVSVYSRYSARLSLG